MSTEIENLAIKITELENVAKAREERDQAMDLAKQGQIATLQGTIDALRVIIGSGGLSSENQALVNASAIKIQITIDSLNAADNTPPIISVT